MGICSICFDSLKRPCCCIPCGHVFCTACIRRWENHSNRPFTFSIRENFNCPQCRADINHIQNIRFDDTENEDTEEVVEDPWEETDDIGNIARSARNIWMQSEIRRSCIQAGNRLLRHSWIRKSWDCVKYLGNSTSDLITEYQQLQGGPHVQHRWLKDKVKEKYQQIKSRVINHHRIATLRTQWSNLHDDKKFIIMVALIVAISLVVADGQNSQGFLQAVLLPFLQAVINISSELLSCFSYCMFRPIVCSAKCLLEVGITFLEMFFMIVRTPVAILQILVVLPYTVVVGLVNFVINTVFMLLRTVVPIFVVAYFLSPEVQRRCHVILAKLQNVGNQEQNQNNVPNE